VWVVGEWMCMEH